MVGLRFTKPSYISNALLPTLIDRSFSNYILFKFLGNVSSSKTNQSNRKENQTAKCKINWERKERRKIYDFIERMQSDFSDKNLNIEQFVRSHKLAFPIVDINALITDN
ncbi:hypothetical protein BGS_0652 [Beggiatoa sp. SS]|nr:hypothetical protein BGS_0652 [Beggiatoa sp. SS]